MKRATRQSRGSAYLAVIGAGMLVSIIGLSAIVAAQVQLRAANQESDFEEARFYALSGIEMGKLWIRQDPAWRTNRTSGTWATKRPIGSGHYTLEVVDPNDNNLSNWATDPVVLTATGFRGSARFLQQAILVPERIPLNCLDAAVTAGGSISLNSATLTCTRTVATNSNFSASSSFVDTNVEASGSIGGGLYYGSRIAGAAPRTLPGTTVFDHYIQNGTPISYLSTGGSLDKVLLSPSSNPFGSSTNPDGIYVVDCGGNSIVIKRSRIVGTLVILNPKSGSKIEDSVNIAPAVATMPSLLIKGSMSFEVKKELLEESGSINFNPPHTPYNGASDNDTVDSYPSQIRGLVYVSGNLTVKETATIEGLLVVGGTIANSGTLSVMYDSIYLRNPPQGFCTIPRMLISPGSWKQVVE